MYSYSLKVIENDEAVSFLIGSRQWRQKNYSKVCNELIGSHLILVPGTTSNGLVSCMSLYLYHAYNYRTIGTSTEWPKGYNDQCLMMISIDNLYIILLSVLFLDMKNS